MVTAYEKMVADMRARIAAAQAAAARAKARADYQARIQASIAAAKKITTTTPPRPGAPTPGAPAAPPPTAPAGPTPTELARQREAVKAAAAKVEAARKAAEEAKRKAEEARRKAEAERKRQEALQRAREARERAEKIKEMARQKRELAKGKPVSDYQARIKASIAAREAIKAATAPGATYQERIKASVAAREAIEIGVKPIPTKVKIPVVEPKHIPIMVTEREKGIEISPDRVFLPPSEKVPEEVTIPTVEPTTTEFIGPSLPTTPSFALPTPGEPVIMGPIKEEPTPSPTLNLLEKKLMESGKPESVKLAKTLYKKRTGMDLLIEPPKPGEPGFIGPIEPEKEPLTFEEKLHVYGKVRQKVFDVGEKRFPGRETLATRIFRREPEEIEEAHMEKEIIDSLAKNEVTSESISEIAKSYNENLNQIKESDKDSKWGIGDKTLSRDESIKFMEKNKPEYELKDVKGVGYAYVGKTIDLTKPDAYEDIVDFYMKSQEFVSDYLKKQAVNQGYKDTLNKNPSVKYIIDYYRKVDPNKADEIEYHLRKDIENQFSYTPIEPTTDNVIQQLFQQMPESKQTDYHVKYTFPNVDDPIDIIGVPGSYKYFSGVTGTKKTEIVDELFDLHKTDKLPEIMGPGGLGFKRILAGKISGVDLKKHNQQVRDYRNKLIDEGHGWRSSYKVKGMLKGDKPRYETALSEEGKRRLYAYEDKLNDERLRIVIWNTLTDPEYTEKTYEKMGPLTRIAYQFGEAAVTVSAIPITLPQAVMKLVTGKTIGIDVGEGLESYRYGPKGVWTTLSQEALSKAGIGAPVGEEEKLLIKERPAEFMAASIGEAASFYGLGKATKLIHAPLTARGVKMPSVTGLTRRGLRYMTPRVKKELTRVFGTKWRVLGKSYFPTTMEQISRARVGKWITPGRGLLGPDLTRRGLGYITKTTKPFTKVITERVPRTFGRGFRERIVSEVTTPKPTLLGRVQMLGRKQLGLIDDTVGYRVSRIPREAGRIPREAARLRATVGKGWEQFRYDWRIPTRESYRAFAGEPIARAGLERAGKTFFRRFTGIERKVGRAVKEKVTRAATGEKPGLLGTQRGTYIETVYKRARGSKWISEKDYNKIVEMFSKKGIKKVGETGTIKLGKKYYYMDELGNITATTKAIATSPKVKQILAAEVQKEVLKKAAIAKRVRPSLRTTMKVFRRETAGRFPLAEEIPFPRTLRAAGRFGRGVMQRFEERPFAAITSRAGRITTPVSVGRPYTMRDVFTTGARVGRKRVSALRGRLGKRAVVKEIIEERIKPVTYAPKGVRGQYYISRLRPAAEVVKRGVKREVADFYFPTTPGGRALGLAGRGIGFTGLGFGLGYRDEIDTTKIIDVERVQERLPGIIQERGVRQITQPVSITERMPVTEKLRGMLPWQVQPQISGLLPMTIQRQKPAFMQEQVLQQQLVTVQPEVDISLELHKPKFPWKIEEEELEERRRRKMLQRQQREVGYKEREYEVPDIFGTRRTLQGKQQFFSLTPQQPRKTQQTITPVRKPVKRPKTTRGKPLYFDTSILESKAK